MIEMQCKNTDCKYCKYFIPLRFTKYSKFEKDKYKYSCCKLKNQKRRN